MNLSSFLLPLTLIVFALWFGGFTFYAGWVVPIGTELMGVSEQGFITQKASNWLNGIGGLSLLMLAWLAWKGLPSRLMRIGWGILLLTWLALILIHPILDSYLDPHSYSVSDPQAFYGWHRAYLLIHTLQWMGMMGIWLLLGQSLSDGSPNSSHS